MWPTFAQKMEMKTVLITGATGMVGRALTNTLLQQGYTVHFLTSRPAECQSIPGALGFVWNLKQGRMDIHALQGVSSIIHLAGATISAPWTPTYQQEILESRVLGLQLLYTQLKKGQHSVRQLISASGTAIYNTTSNELRTEADALPPSDFLSGVVVRWEEAAQAFSALHIEVSCMRTGVVLDAHQGAFPVIAKPFRMGLGAVLGTGQQFFPWIHLHDLVQAYVWVLQGRAQGVINAVAPECINNRQLTQQLKGVFRQKLSLPAVPTWALCLAMGPRADLVLKGAPITPKVLTESGFEWRYPQIEAALASVAQS